VQVLDKSASISVSGAALRSTRTLAVTMNRRALIMTVGGLFAFGVGAILIFLSQSLWPSERAKADAVKLEVALPRLATYQSVEGRFARLFVVRTSDDHLLAFRVPLKDGKVGMPDLHWWQPFYYCADFRLGGSDGALAAATDFQCHDSDMPEWWASRWRWALNGKAISPDSGIDDMPQVKIERVGERVRIYTWDASM
jgi:hypothetical protein